MDKIYYDKINITEDDKSSKNTSTQLKSFIRGMRLLLIYGFIFGLYPVTGFLQKDITKIRFKIFSFKMFYAMIWIIIQSLIFALCFQRVLTLPLSIGTLFLISSYCSVWCSSIVFIKISSKWSELIKEINNCNLNEYVDPKVIKNINLTCIVTLFLTSLDFVFVNLARIAYIKDCIELEQDLFEQYLRRFHPFLFDFGIPYSLPYGIVTQIINLVIIFNWTYIDLFIVCFSQYLTSILKQINKKIIWAADKTYLSSSIWCVLREDYTRATGLLRHFDDTFSGLIFVSFAKNLIFSYLTLFNLLANGLDKSVEKCVKYPNGALQGYEYPIYWSYSLVFLFVRFLAVSLTAAGVHAASLEPAKALYRIPSCAYSKEAQRFLEQVHGDMVALSGWKYFHVTRGLILSISATIVTYELVLLQFNNDELNNI